MAIGIHPGAWQSNEDKGTGHVLWVSRPDIIDGKIKTDASLMIFSTLSLVRISDVWGKISIVSSENLHTYVEYIY